MDSKGLGGNSGRSWGFQFTSFPLKNIQKLSLDKFKLRISDPHIVKRPWQNDEQVWSESRKSVWNEIPLTFILRLALILVISCLCCEYDSNWTHNRSFRRFVSWWRRLGISSYNLFMNAFVAVAVVVFAAAVVVLAASAAIQSSISPALHTV